MSISLHTANIAVHVVSGVTAMVLGCIILAGAKGDDRHVRRGRVFVAFMIAVVATAAIGAVYFRAAPTLVAITCLVAYQLTSGVRAGSGARPGVFDTSLALAAFVGGVGFLIYLLTGAPAFWRPQVTIPTGITLMLVAGYDLIRLAVPAWRARVYPLEHGVKMMMAIGALMSAGLGTVAPAWQPWSQIGPSIFVSLFAIGYVLLRWRAALELRTAKGERQAAQV
jgi:uncharacterized membrane protein